MMKPLIAAALGVATMHASALQTYDWSISWTSGWLAGTVESSSFTFNEVGKAAGYYNSPFNSDSSLYFNGTAVDWMTRCSEFTFFGCQVDTQPRGLISSSATFNLGSTGGANAVRDVPGTNWSLCYPGCPIEWSSGTTTFELRAVPPVSPIPEPSTYLLMVIGIAGIGAARKRFSPTARRENVLLK